MGLLDWLVGGDFPAASGQGITGGGGESGGAGADGDWIVPDDTVEVPEPEPEPEPKPEPVIVPVVPRNDLSPTGCSQKLLPKLGMIWKAEIVASGRLEVWYFDNIFFYRKTSSFKSTSFIESSWFAGNSVDIPMSFAPGVSLPFGKWSVESVTHKCFHWPPDTLPFYLYIEGCNWQQRFYRNGDIVLSGEKILPSDFYECYRIQPWAGEEWHGNAPSIITYEEEDETGFSCSGWGSSASYTSACVIMTGLDPVAAGVVSAAAVAGVAAVGALGALVGSCSPLVSSVLRRRLTTCRK